MHISYARRSQLLLLLCTLVNFCSSFHVSPINDGLPTSSPKYPSPWLSPSNEWADAYSKAEIFVKQLTLLEKVNLTTGVGWSGGRCLGNTGSIPRLGFPGLCAQDVPLNVSFADFTTAFPAGMNVAATWEIKYAYAHGNVMGAEFRDRGADILLRPVCSPLGIHPEDGRRFEGFSPDPHLSGELIAPTVKGIQDAGVIANAKHYFANEQEHFRHVPEAASNGFNITASVSAYVDDKTMHELFLWPFANAVKAGTASIMCSYNQINNSYGCSNSYTLNYLLKNELDFQGFVLTDYGAQQGGVNAAFAGMDMSLPGDSITASGFSCWGPNFTLAVANGTVPEWRLDDMCIRIMSAYYKVGRDKINTSVNFDSFALTSDAQVPALDPKAPIQHVNDYANVRANHKDLVREISRASIVMLKNSGALPLSGNESRVAIVGEDARSDPDGINGCRDRSCLNGTLAMGWGSGSWLFPYLVTPEQAISSYVETQTNGSVSSVTNNWADTSIEYLAIQASVALVFVNADSGEAYLTVDGNYGDRNNLTLWKSGDDLIRKVSSICNNTVVIMHTVGPVLVSEWYDNPNITGILWAGLPGQESGNSLVDVLYGSYNPSGKLPFTLGATHSDYGSTILYSPNNGANAPQTNLSGLHIDYRYFDAHNITPIYKFGFGLSYATFSYSNLTITPTGAAPYVPTTGSTKPAPSFRNPNDTISANLSTYLFPADNPHYERYIYPYFPSTNTSAISSSPLYGLPGSTYLPPGYNDSSPQPLLPAGGAPGGNPGLWEALYNVTATITNTGPVPGYEVVQLYVGLEGDDEPPRVLRGF